MRTDLFPFAKMFKTVAAPFTPLWRNWGLVRRLAAREISSRYRGTFGGILWAVISPLVLLLVYTFVFTVVFKSRWPSGHEHTLGFATVLFVGIIVHGIFSECAMRAPGLILANTNLVKKVVFPLEILAYVALATALFHASISICVLVVVIFLSGSSISLIALSLPLILLPLVVGMLGVIWILSSLGVFIRDIGQVIGLIVTVTLFMSPVFYPVESLPEVYQAWLRANPLSYYIEESRNVLLWGRLPDVGSLTGHYIGSLILALIGFVWFQKTRKGFADVL